MEVHVLESVTSETYNDMSLVTCDTYLWLEYMNDD